MTKYIKDKNTGKLAGSIGDGKTQTPTPSPTPTHIPNVTTDERKRIIEEAHEFLRRVAATPESERVLITSDKFADPIGQVIVNEDLNTIKPELRSGETS